MERNNGSNSWGVSYGRVMWFQGVLESHGNVTEHARRDDIVFDVRLKSGKAISILCLDEYVLGISATQKAIREFSNLDIIFVGGNWNSYTREAKEFCLHRKQGLFNAEEINGALWKDEFWSYVKRDEDGNPNYPYKVE